MGNAAEVKIAVKALIAQNVDLAVKRLEEIIDPASPAYNTFVLLKSRYNQYKNNVVLGMLGQDELNKQYAQISHAFIVSVDGLEDSDLKAIVPPPAPSLEIPPQQAEQVRPREEAPAAKTKADKPTKTAKVSVPKTPKPEPSRPADTEPASTASRKYQIMGAAALGVVAVVIWVMLSGKEKPTASSVTPENKASLAEIKQPDTASLTTSTLPQTSAAPPQTNANPQKAVEEPAPKASAPPTTETDKIRVAPATLSASGVSFDGKTYRIFRTGGLTWMAQNLDYELPGSWCYGGSEANCSKYGRLYTLQAAKKACAAMGAGWRVPTSSDWKRMTSAYGGAGEDASDGGAAAFKALTGGGFSAQLSGWRNEQGNFKHLGSAGYYWTSSENDLGLIQLYLFSGGELSVVNNDPKLGFSCRCVK